jgi:uncharacterized RDD family membrane protein YckC
MMCNGEKYKLASFNRRILSSGIDMIIASIFTIPLGNGIANFVNTEKLDKIHMNPEFMIDDMGVSEVLALLWDAGVIENIILIQLFTLCLIGVYAVFFWVRKGATLGKMLCKCQVVDAESFQKLSIKQAVIRFIMIPFSMLPLLIGLFMINWNNQRQALHDKVAKTIVIYKKQSKAV